MQGMVLHSIKDHISTISFNRPESGNPLDIAMFSALRDALRSDAENDDVRVIVLTGEGKHFSAGGDIKDMQVRIDEERYISAEEIRLIDEITLELRRIEKPTIAMINHAAAGGGCAIALACDFRVVQPSSLMVMAYINVALAGDTIGLYLLTKLVGTGRAIDMMMTGRPVNGVEAYRIGLAGELAEEGKLEETAYELAAKLAASPGEAIKRQKALVNQYFYSDIEAYIQDEAIYLEETSRTEDFREAVSAFLEKRKPVFQSK